MNRKEFLEILRSQLAGQMQEGKAAAHIRYYEDYIQSQVRGGRSEQEVLQELGDPHLIAKTLIDTDDGSTQEDYGEYSSYGSSYGNETELPHQQEKRWKKVIDLSTWHGRAVVIAAAAVIIVLLILIIGVAIPFFIILAIILYFLFLENPLVKSYNDYKENNMPNQFKHTLLIRKEFFHHERNKRNYHRYDELPRPACKHPERTDQ